MYSLSEAIGHGQKGELPDAQEHAQCGIRRLSFAAQAQPTPKTAEPVSNPIKVVVIDAVRFARQAEASGAGGDLEGLRSNGVCGLMHGTASAAAVGESSGS